MSYFEYRRGVRGYLLRDDLIECRLDLPMLTETAAALELRAAFAADPKLANRLRNAFPQLDGGRAAEPSTPPAELADHFGKKIGQGQLSMLDLGPFVRPVDHIDEAPIGDGGADPSLTDKIGRVIRGLADVPVEAIFDGGGQAFTELRDEMLNFPAMVTTMVTVFVTWAAAHAGPLGWVIDAALLGIVFYRLRLQAIEWFELVASLIGMIGSLQSNADYAAASVALARLLAKIGVKTLVTLLTRASGKKTGTTGGKGSADLKIAPSKPASGGKPKKTSDDNKTPDTAKEPPITGPKHDPKHHNAVVTVKDKSGETQSRERIVSGNMTPEEKALKFPKNTLASHTEARAMKKDLKPGESMRIEGERPPCPSCKGAMNKKAAESGANIEYHWVQNGENKVWVAKPKGK